MEYLSHNERETEALGAALAARLRPGDVVAYLGDCLLYTSPSPRD